MHPRRDIRLLLCCLLATSAVATNRTHAQTSSTRLPVVVAGPEAGTRTLVYDYLQMLGPSITRRLFVQQSMDGGETFSTPVPIPVSSPDAAPRIISNFQTGPSLLRDPHGGYLLFFHYDGTGYANLWRDVSADGLDFHGTTLVDAGWPDAGGTDEAGSTFPSIVIDGAASMTMLYLQYASDGPFPVGLYVSRSSDLGLTWPTARTLIAADAALHVRPMLAHRPQDGRYVAAYGAEPTSGDGRVRVRTTTNPLDWNAAPVLEIQGNSSDPALVVMSDGAFVLLYSRAVGNQRDLFSRRSEDGLTWGAEHRLTDSPDNLDLTPYGVATASPGVIEIYWSRTPDLVSGGIIVRDLHAIIVDPVFADGFGD